MELWIRSQDKLTLMKTTYVYVAREEVCAYDENKCWSTIGVYETQERALEILDEIQYLLNNNFCYNKELNQYITCNNAIYEMPKD
ncbi:MAG: hypothetical protein IJ568_05460 [Bacilli bacterium]|nr:hypothetical protein [Bacilli bacterium]